MQKSKMFSFSFDNIFYYYFEIIILSLTTTDDLKSIYIVVLWSYNYLFIQDYLREQPDNLKSFNIIGEVTQFLNCIYSNITGKNIDLTIQLFESINEFTAVSIKCMEVSHGLGLIAWFSYTKVMVNWYRWVFCWNIIV